MRTKHPRIVHDTHYTLPASNIRVRDEKARGLFTEIQQIFKQNYGIDVDRTAIMERALEDYRDWLLGKNKRRI